MINKKDLEETHQLIPQFEKRGGLLPVVVQEYSSKDILMLGYANQDAWEETLKSGLATFWSTSRKELWTKGKTSGDFLEIQDILLDCDQDAIIYVVNMAGAGACHTKNKAGQTRKSCFYRKVKQDELLILDE